MKKLLAGLAAAVAFTVSVAAADFGPAPANYQAAAESYIGERLADPRNARVQYVGDPYKVYADLAGYEGLACWAIDVRVKSRLPNGAYGGYVPYTLLFLNGRPIAFKEDVRRLVRA